MRSTIRSVQKGGGPKPPRGSFAAIFGLVALAGGSVLVQNSLFNVDGGHRAIKYRRVTGVSKEIYSEGMVGTLPACPEFGHNS